jgi:hypothetical protein
MKGKFAELITSDIRLVILRALAEDLGYSHNESIIQSVVEAFGHKTSRDCIRTELHWLEEQHLLGLSDVAGCLVATITKRGADVAAGNATVPGVKRPGPRG